MSSLIVLCPHCLTWIEIHGQCCTECAGDVYLDDADPPAEELNKRLGDWLQDLGGAKLLRRGWPNIGRLIVSTEGLLFVPHFVLRPNGALDATTEGTIAGPARVKDLLHWWSLPIWRRPADDPLHPKCQPLKNNHCSICYAILRGLSSSNAKRSVESQIDGGEFKLSGHRREWCRWHPFPAELDCGNLCVP